MQITTTKNQLSNPSGKTINLHQQFVQLGRERNKITYKLLALLPKIYKAKIYETEGYATIYEYAGKLAGLPHSVVEKSLKLEDKLKNKPCLQKIIETQGIHKVALVAKIATSQTDSFFADKVENMSKPALQQFSKEFRGKIQTNWQIDLDSEMMTMFLKIKKNFGENLSNKEAMRRMLKMMASGVAQMSGITMMAKNKKPQPQAKKPEKIPGDFTVTRYIPVIQKRLAIEKTTGKCSYQNCHLPAQILHHQIPFSQNHNHNSIIPLCKIHHEFEHNGITKPLDETDNLYRKCRQKSLTEIT